MGGFTIICNVCKKESTLEHWKDRLDERVKIDLNGIRTLWVYCSNCGQDIILK
jgi:hypothetical protein